MYTDIFHSIREILSASAPAHKAWATRKANQAKRSEAAIKAWATMKSPEYKRSQAAYKAWENRRAA